MIEDKITKLVSTLSFEQLTQIMKVLTGDQAKEFMEIYKLLKEGSK